MLRAQFHRITEENLVGAFGRRDAFGSARYDDTSSGYQNFTQGNFGKFENHSELTSQEFNRALERLGVTNPSLRAHFFSMFSRSRDARRTGISFRDVAPSGFIEPRDVSHVSLPHDHAESPWSQQCCMLQFMSGISLLTAHGRDHHPGLVGYSSGKLDLTFKMFDVPADAGPMSFLLCLTAMLYLVLYNFTAVDHHLRALCVRDRLMAKDS